MSDPRFALLSAVYETLSNDATLAALTGGRIHDHVPRGEPHPFVAFGALRTVAADADAAPASEHVFEIDAHSRQEGRAEASAIADRVAVLLHDAALALDGHRLAQLRHLDTRIRPSRDRRAFRAVARFRALTEPLS